MMSVSANSINFKNIADDMSLIADQHKMINSFGLGDTDQIAWYITLRDNQPNDTFESPIFPLYYVVPGQVENNIRFKTWTFNNVVMDIVEESLVNQVEVLSDTLQTLQDIMSQFRLSTTSVFGDFNKYYWLDETVNCTPFIEQYQDSCNGWNAILRIKTTTPLDRCAAAFNTFTGTPIQHDWINLKTIEQDLQLLADHHKQIKSYGFGSMQDLLYWNEIRDKKENVTYESPIYPLMYVIPADTQQIISDDGSSWTNYQLNVMVLDIIERDLSNQIDVLSDTNQILDDIISQFRLSVTDSLGNFNAKYYLDDTVICNPFIEKFADLNGGWNGILNIKVMTPLDRCDAAFKPFLTRTPLPTPTQTPGITPSNTPSNTPSKTPTQTPTNTETPTTTPSETPTNTPTSTTTQTPTNTETSTPTNTPTQTQTPTNTETSTPTNTPTNTQTGTPTQTPTNTETPTQTPTNTQTGTPTNTPTNTETSTLTQTPTNTETPTQTPTNTQTETPTQTPTNTETSTPTQTPTNTSTPTNTQSGTPTQTPTNTNTPTASAPATDADATAYLNAVVTAGGTGITSTVSAATQTMFISLKNNSLYTKLYAFYPMLGGVAASVKFNALNPLDTNAAYRLTFVGGTTFAQNKGIIFNGINANAETFFNANTVGVPYTSYTFFDYVTTSGNTGYDIGAAAVGIYTGMASRLGGNFYGEIIRNGQVVLSATSVNTGVQMVSRNGSTSQISFIMNGSDARTITQNTTSTSQPNRTVLFGVYGGVGLYSDKAYSTMGIAQGLSTSEMNTLRNILNTFNSTIGR